MASCLFTVVMGMIVFVVGGVAGGRLAGAGGMFLAAIVGLLVLLLGFLGFGC